MNKNTVERDSLFVSYISIQGFMKELFDLVFADSSKYLGLDCCSFVLIPIK